MSVSTEGDASSSNNHANRVRTQHQNELSLELQDLTLDSDFTSLPTPLVLPPADLLDTYETINVLAPLVRCSKLPFRHLCSLYETHITHTPMILAEEFSRAQTARLGDFSTSTEERGVFWMEPRKKGQSHNGALGDGPGRDGEREGKQSSSIVKEHTLRQPSNGDSEVEVELEAEVEHSARPNCDTEDIYNIRNDPISYCRPAPHRRLPPTPRPPTPNSQLVRGVLLAQFASPNGPSLADAAELIAPYVDGLDLNCGCPQKWAYHEGIGCALLRKPELVRDMVKCVKDRMGWGWPVSIKIRVDPDLALTNQLITTALSIGVSHITIHGRTRHQPSTAPVNHEAIKFAVECVKGQVPTVGNGDIWDLGEAATMRETGVRGVMGARGLLANPALFAGYDKTPKHAVEQFTNLSLDYGLIFPLFQKHLAYMLESHLSKPQRTYFNSMTSSVGAIDFLLERGFNISSMRGTVWDGQRGRSLL